MIRYVLIDQEGNRYYSEKGDVHTSVGVVKEKDIHPGVLQTHTGKPLICYAASFVDHLQKIKRGPAILLAKDIGMILATTGVGKDSVVVDAGAGTGVLAAMLVRVCKKVTSYEAHPDHFKVAEENFKRLDVNVTLKHADIAQGITEKNVDLITLDLQDPIAVLLHAHQALKSGGFLVAYIPQISLVQQFVLAAQKSDFFHEKTIELLEREWIIEEKRLRPQHQMLGHTAFLVFLRKI